MKDKDDLTGQVARLPDGQQVRIETVYSDGYASVRRIEGEWKGRNAVCSISKLELLNNESHIREDRG